MKKAVLLLFIIHIFFSCGINLSSSGANTSTETDGNKIPAPFNLSSENKTSYNKDVIEISYTIPDNDYAGHIDGIAMYRSESADGPFTKIGTKNYSSSYVTDTNVESGKIYYYKIALVLDNGTEGRQSATLKVQSVPPRVLGFNAEESGIDIRLSWNNITAHYDFIEIYAKTSPYSDERALIAVVEEQAECLVTPPTNRHTYFNANTVWGKAKGVSSSADVYAVPLLPAPQIVQVSSQTYTEAEIRWSLVKNAVSYDIYRNTSSYNFYSDELLASDITENTYLDNELPTIGYSYYHVVPKRFNGLQGASKSCLANYVSLPEISNFTLSIEDNRIRLNWDPLSDPGLMVRLRIEHLSEWGSTSSQLSYPFLTNIDLPYDSSEYTFSKLEPGTDYRFIVSTNFRGRLSKSSQKTVFVPPVPSGILLRKAIDGIQIICDYDKYLMNDSSLKVKRIRLNDPADAHSFSKSIGYLNEYSKNQVVFVDKTADVSIGYEYQFSWYENGFESKTVSVYYVP